MRLLIAAVVLITLLTGCYTVQIVYTAPTNKEVKENKDGYYSFEDSCVRVTYAFWAKSGVMSVLIENKLSVPLYIDWKKCAFVDKKTKYNYYSDIVTSNTFSTSTSTPYLYRSAFNWAKWYPVVVGISETNSTSEREERISFIPPKSQTGRAKFLLVPYISKFNMENSVQKEYEIEGQSQKIKAHELNSTQENATLLFTNFLTYSFKESFDTEYYISNEFYVRKVVEVKSEYLDMYEDAKRFYLEN